MNKIGIEKPTEGKWFVTAEKGRIDILLRRENPHSVVIIENKSNMANDQNNQLYRYWFHQIHNHNIKEHSDYAYTGKYPEKYKIIYLIPTSGKQPTLKSLTKPDYLLEDLPKDIPIIPTIWRFDNEIVEWLTSTLNDIPEKNHRLKEFLKQYIDFWI